MKEKNKKVWVLTRAIIAIGFIAIFLVAGILTVWRIWVKEQNNQYEVLKLTTPIIYDSNLKQTVSYLLDDDTRLVFYNTEDNAVVSNPDFYRSATVKLMGVAGDASVLFPGSNALLQGEEGFCILGKEAAVDLFGTTKAIGRKVEIRGKGYYVAGIAYGGEANLCVYEISENEGMEVENIAFGYRHRSEQGILRRKLKNIFL